MVTSAAAAGTPGQQSRRYDRHGQSDAVAAHKSEAESIIHNYIQDKRVIVILHLNSLVCFGVMLSGSY